MRRLFQWLFVFGLTAVAPIIALQTYTQSPRLPTTILPLWQQFLPVLLLSIGVAISAVCVLKVPAYLHSWPQELKLTLLALLAVLTLIVLWLAILLAYYSLSVPVLTTAVAPPYVLILGSAATLFLILGTFYWADHLYLQSLSVIE